LNLFEFGFEFNRFPPVTGQTGPVNRNRSPAVTGNRLGNKTLLSKASPLSFSVPRKQETAGQFHSVAYLLRKMIRK